VTLVGFGDDGADSAGSLVRCRNSRRLLGGVAHFLQHPALFLSAFVVAKARRIEGGPEAN
jgi:hypothetical protein